MKTESNMQIFKNEQFGNVRTFKQDTETYFVAKDVCVALGLENPSVAVQQLDEDERAKRNLGRQGSTWLISESGLYSLIFRSNKTEAKHFRKWITSEVLPTIRKTGGYLLTKEDDTEETIKARAMKVAEQAIKLHEERSNRLEVEKAMLIEERDRIREILNASQAKRYQEAHEYNRRLSLIEMLDSDNLYRLKYRKKEIILDRIIAICFERGVYIYKDEGNPMHTIVPAIIYQEVMEEYEKGKLD